MTSTQKVLATGGVAALVVLNVVAFFHVLDNNDPPILIGDGSILFSADKIDKNSNKQLEVSKLLHKVYSITTVDLSPGGSQSTMDVKGKDWTLTSASGAVVVSLDPVVLGQGVKADCSSDWNGIGTYYSCDPTDGSKLTPATLKFNAGDGPASCTSTCTLSCMSGKCQIRLDYKK